MAKQIGYFTCTKHPSEGTLGFLFKKYKFLPDIRIPRILWNLMPIIVVMIGVIHLFLAIYMSSDVRLSFWIIDSNFHITIYNQIQAMVCFFLAYIIIYARNRYHRHQQRLQKISR